MFMAFALVTTSTYCHDDVIDEAMINDIAPTELYAMIQTTDMMIYDCNEKFIYEDPHVPGAILTVYDQLTEEYLPSDRDTPMVFYCLGPDRSAGEMAAKTAAEMGYTNVLHMHEGIFGWEEAGLATAPYTKVTVPAWSACTGRLGGIVVDRARVVDRTCDRALIEVNSC
ncbi:MAG: rhodanese-like domain-containing protein [Flavobacteriales bacterium]|nr:rhodanese-like domain-containing protein [Flavobacteriales bacterium]